MRTDELDFHLPEDRIATAPANPRDAARLLVVHRETRKLRHAYVRDLPDLGVLQPGDLMLVNQTRVLDAYLTGERVNTGGGVTGLFLQECSRDEDPQAVYWRLMLESGGKLREGETIQLDETASLALHTHEGRGVWLAKLIVDGANQADHVTYAVLARVGSTPLPPYIRKARKRLNQPQIHADDAATYNTVYAAEPGSVAAPTAGLHFTPALLNRLEQAGVRRAAVTLNVGIGTFTPIRTDTLDAHVMHREFFRVPADTLQAIQQVRQAGGRLFVVGTTTVRALESLPADALEREPVEDIAMATQLFIHPEAGFEFRFTDRLMTNFHLPRSSLLAMVASLPGLDLDFVKAVYREAIEHGYRFYSYGDAMVVV